MQKLNEEKEESTNSSKKSFLTTSGPVRIITAASLFDGHDAAINVFRRLMQECGAEVIHLGHDRSAWDLANAVYCKLNYSIQLHILIKQVAKPPSGAPSPEIHALPATNMGHFL